MLLKGIPTMTATKAARGQHAFKIIPATLECPHTCPIQVSCSISFWLVCKIRIVLVLRKLKSGFTRHYEQNSRVLLPGSWLLQNICCHVIPSLGH